MEEHPAEQEAFIGRNISKARASKLFSLSSLQIRCVVDFTSK
jgi:hypothetical protein